MAKERIQAHPSIVIAHDNLERFLFSVYDSGYPRAAYRLSANLVGGNPDPEGKDDGPESTLIREIAEEFNPNHPVEKQFIGKVDWAPEGDIRYVRNQLLGRLEPLQDFFIKQDEEIPGGNNPYSGIYSVFLTTVSTDAIDYAKRSLSREEHMNTEGLIGVYTLQDLEKHDRGEFGTAHATAHALNWQFKANIPHPRQISAEPMGQVRRTYADYEEDFAFGDEDKRKASNAET